MLAARSYNSSLLVSVSGTPNSTIISFLLSFLQREGGVQFLEAKAHLILPILLNTFCSRNARQTDSHCDMGGRRLTRSVSPPTPAFIYCVTKCKELRTMYSKTLIFTCTSVHILEYSGVLTAKGIYSVLV